jgi:tight adherence protein B
VPLVLALLAALVALATPAQAAATSSAAPSGRIGPVEVADDELHIVFTGVALPSGVAVDPDTVAVTVGGIPVDSKAAPVGETQQPTSRTAVLTFDTSGSMAGDGIAGAKDAAAAFLDVVPDDVAVALVTFDADTRVVVPPTVNHAAVAAAVERLAASDQPGTRLYDATIQATEVAGTDGIRNVVLLSDGQDSGGGATLDDATGAIASSGVQVDAVALGSRARTYLPELSALASAGGGTAVATADPDELASLFEQSAQTIVNQVAITAAIPAELVGDDARVVVTATAGDSSLEDSALVTLAAAEAPAPPAWGPIPVQPGWVVSPPLMWGALGALAVGLAVALFFVLGGFRVAEVTQIGRRLSVYSLAGSSPIKEAETTTVLGESAMARSAVEMANKVVKRRGFEEDLGHRLDAAAVPLRPAEWLLIHFASALGAGLVGLLASRFNLAWAILGLIVGTALPFAYLSIKRSRRQAAFLEQLPDTLHLVAGSLAAGYSLPQALDAAAREGQDPISTEFDRALVEARLGVPLDEALESVAERMQSSDFHWVVLAIGIQRRTGGNLAELLTNVANTLREREQLRRQVKVLSAEGRLSAWILALLPLAFAGYLVVTQPEYLAPLITDVLGWILLGVGAAMLAIGAFWLSRVVKVEV